MNLFDLHDRVALITGASRGIGFAAARALGSQGATVILNGRTASTLHESVKELREAGIAATASVFDVSDLESSRIAIDDLIDAHGHIDIVFANAGVIQRKSLFDHTLDDFKDVLLTDLTAQWSLGRHLAKHMAAHHFGRIIFTGSIVVDRARRDIGGYVAAKSAIHGMVRQWATEFLDNGITVNAIAPGYIKTELTRALWEDDKFNQWLFDRVPQHRWGTPEDVGAAVAFLSSAEAGFITGQILTVDGGLTGSL